MSEYQYYEFRTVRKPLSREEQAEVNKWSSRGEVTPTSAKFVYQYSDFRHDPETCLLYGFDMMLYISNWGHRRLMFRFPEKEVDYERLKDYRWDRDAEASIQIYKKNAYIVIDMDESLEDGDGNWVEGEGILPALTPLWMDIHKGNFACLYLIWLHFETNYQKSMMDENDEESAEDVFEPPVPAGMNKSAASLAEFMEFWNISEDLFKVAAEASPEVKTISKTNVEKQIKELSEQDKTSFLTRFLLEEPSAVQMSLQKHLQKQFKDKIDTPQITRRNLQEILELQKEHTTRRIA